MISLPKTIKTLIEAEQIVEDENLFLSEQIIEKNIDDRKYIIHFIVHKIRSCLVFDQYNNLIDYYDNGASQEPIYKSHSYWYFIFNNQ